MFIVTAIVQLFVGLAGFVATTQPSLFDILDEIPL